MPRIILRTQRFAIVFAITLLASLPALAQTSTWEIDPAHSTAQFTVRHLGISNVTGSFTKVTGSIVLNEKDITQSQVSVTIDVNSVDTRVEMRDKDLRSPNFFDVEKYPTIEFKSKRIASNGGKLRLIGDLTIHGTTHEVARCRRPDSCNDRSMGQCAPRNLRDNSHQPQRFQLGLQQNSRDRRGGGGR
jgi:polyisoprenoid-binding protein YceI